MLGKTKTKKTYRSELQGIKSDLNKRLEVIDKLPVENDELEVIEKIIAECLGKVDELLKKLGKYFTMCFFKNCITNPTYILIGVLSFVLGVQISWLFKSNQFGIFFTSCVPALATLIAAYFGAKCAFNFHSNKEAEKERKEKIVSGNIVLFNFLQMINKLLAFQRQSINPHRENPVDFLEMEPTNQLTNDDISIDLNSIYFVLETENMNILGEISIEISKFKTALDIINERSNFLVDEVYPALERAGVVSGVIYPPEHIEAALGNRLFVTIQDMTKNVVQQVDETLVSIHKVSDDFSQLLKTQFAGESIISVSIPDEVE